MSQSGRGRTVRLVAGVAAVGLVSTVAIASGGGTAGAATPNAQAVGRLLDGLVGGNPIQALADVKDARATAPGTTSVQNPLTVTALGAITLPLDNAINIPTGQAADAGAVNQVATANVNGKSLGAAGAVADDGGANLGNKGSGEPTAAKINLTGAALGNVTIPGLPALPGLPATGGTSLAALGGLTGSIHGIFARAATEKGGDVETPSSGIADIDLTLGSPALGALIKQLKTVFTTANLGAIPGLGAVLSNAVGLPSDCALTDPLASNIDFNNGVVIDVQNAAINVSVQKLLQTLLGVDISNLDTSNFDLTSFLVKQLPTILSKGLSSVITGITTALNSQFAKCTSALDKALGATVFGTISSALQGGQMQIVDAITGIANQLGTAGSGGLAQLADGLKNLVDIGLNVQSGPGIEPEDSNYPFSTSLAATPSQATPVVDNQTLVRAIEISVLKSAAVSSGSVGTVALANAAAGPSNVEPTVVASTSAPATVVPATNIPTGIPAGQAGGADSNGGLPVLPLVAILALLGVVGGTTLHLRSRGGLHRT